MVRRSRKSFSFGRSLQRSITALTKATLRTGTRAVVKAMVDAGRPVARQRAERRRLPASSGGTWSQAIALGPAGGRRYQIFEPAPVRPTALRPMLVLLHGCAQDASAIARSSRLQAIAAREGFLLLCPEQERLANPQGCWNWFETRSGRADAEATSILAAIDQACLLHGGDPVRVAIAGFSAGAGMAALLGLRHPTRFAAVAMHSGVGPNVAHSTATAIAAMQGRRRSPAWLATPGLPPLLVIQGSADHVVAAANGAAAAEAWASAVGARATAARRVQRGSRRAMAVTDFRLAGRTRVSLCEIEGLAHAWSGGARGQPYSDAAGPDAGRMIWRFAQRAFETGRRLPR